MSKTVRPILDRFHVDFEQVKMSKKWFNNQVEKFPSSVTPNQLLLKDGIETMTTNVRPGNLYFFYYDPKLKETLPYYDQFPMVFPYKPAPGGFLGLNLHYLGYKERFALFKELLKINGGTLDSRTKLNYQWGTITAMSNVKTAQHCIKHYLVDHVKSRYMKVAPNDWTTAMLLPVERFVGEEKERIWANNKR